MTWLARNYPRRFGIPEQREVRNNDELFSLLYIFNTEKNCYVSVNSYTKDKLVLEQVCFDFDGNIEDALADLRTACKTLDDLKILYKTFFSGKKGFHLRIPTLSYSCGFVDGKKITRAIQLGIAEGLKTFDRHLVGDVKRILRFPNTLHIDTGLYCVEINPELDLQEILTYAKTPKKLSSVNPKNVKSPEDLYKLFSDVGLITTKNIERNGNNQSAVKHQYSDKFVNDEALFKSLFPQGCYRKHLKDKNPPHTIRVGSCIWLVYLGFDLLWLLAFYKDLAYKYDWDDKDNSVRREKAIFDLFKRQYNPVSCGKIKERGYCEEADCEWKEY